jgi:hypothetical protein
MREEQFLAHGALVGGASKYKVIVCMWEIEERYCEGQLRGGGGG